MDKCLDFIREFRKLWNMKVTLIPIIIRALETFPKKDRAKKGYRGIETSRRIVTIQSTAKIS